MTAHYKVGGIECIQYLQAKLSKEQFVGFLTGNVIKYLSRMDYKDCRPADIEKANVYAQWLKNFESTGDYRGKESVSDVQA